MYVHAPEKVEFVEYYEIESELLNTACLPTFGAKKDNNAFIASIHEGDTDAFFHFNEFGFAVDLNRIHTEFTFRHSFELFLSEISVQGSLPGGGTSCLQI